MKHPHLLAWALSTPWAMRPESMAAYAMVLAAHYGGRTAMAAALQAHQPQAGEVQAAAPGSGKRQGGMAIIPVMGPIVEWPSQIDMCEGGTSTRQIMAALADVEADETISSGLMVYSTPGGSVYGVEEVCAVINRVKAKKPIFGVAQSLAASAGYWMLSQCSEAYCTPGGEVGSIGVYSGHEDISKALEMAGISIELFSAGEFKTEGHPFGPMTEEGKNYHRQRALDYYGSFAKGVSKGRNVPIEAVRKGMGQGRVVGADMALAEKMIDGIATMEEVMGKLQRAVRANKPARSALAAARADIDIVAVA